MAAGRPIEAGTLDALGGVVAIAIERVQRLEERKTGERTRQSEELKTALLASVGHDLRTPLTAIRVAATNIQASSRWTPRSFLRPSALVPEALSHGKPGGTVVCAGIHMSDIPAFPYQRLWEERSIRSVANLTRRHAREFLAFAADVPIETHVHVYPLAQANRALDDLRQGRFGGAAVLLP